MSELLRSQRELQNYLLDLHSILEAGTSLSAARLDALIVESERVPRAVRLHIYANAYRARFVEALSVDFNGLHAYLGDDAFTELIHAYIEQNPSHSFSLRNLGSTLANFLQVTHPYAEHIELHELAMFEWALCHAFDAADSRCAEIAHFSAMPTEQWQALTLQFVPALRVIALHSNAPAIWKALNSEQAPPAVEFAADDQPWIVWRRDLTLLFRPLDDIEKTALDVFMRGETFADVCGELVEQLPESEVPQRAAVILQQWLNDGLIAAS
jgi:hypothetical protein